MTEDDKRDDQPAGQHDSGRDPAIGERLRRKPNDPDAKLDRGLDESMDASDPPSVTSPGGNEPAPSSGYAEEAERAKDA